MRLTIIPVDGAVYVNGVSYAGLDLSFVPADVHALQWYDTFGELEFKRSFVDGKIVHSQNQVITELPSWANVCVTKWNEAKASEEIAKQEALNQLQAQGTQTL